MNIAKKIFAVATSGAIAVASLAAFAGVASAAVHSTGTNVVSNGTVYFLDGTSKRPYTSAGAFLSYGFNSWAGVVAASPEDLALPTGAFVPAADGSLINDKGTVYLITNGQREGFTSAANFLGLGYSFSNVLAGDTSFMTSGPVISTTDMAHPAGTLVNQAGTVYLITSTGKQGIPSLAVFNSWGYSFGKVAPANSYDNALPMSSGIMPTFMAGCLSPLNCTSTGTGTGTGTGTTPPPTGNVAVTLSTDSPAGSPTVVASQASADIGNFTFNGTGTVTSLTFTRTGVSSNNALDNVYLYQGGTRLTSGASVSTNNTVTFANANGLFTVSGPTEIMVTADIDKLATAGQTVGFQLTAGMTGATAIAGVPVSSNMSSIAVAQNLAAVTIGNSAANSNNYGVTPVQSNPDVSVNAGTSNYVLFSSPISIAQHAVVLKSAAFQYIGSASSTALQNWGLYVDGAQVATATGVNANNYVTFTPATPVALNTGSHTLEVHADIIGGSNRNVQLSIQNGSDLLFYDTNYNVGVTPINFGSSASFFSPVTAGQVAISTGTLSATLDPSFNTTTNIPSGATNQVISSWQLQAYGENVQVNTLNITPVLTSPLISGSACVVGTPTGNTCGLQNVSLYYNGAQVGTTQNWSGSGAIPFNLGSSLIISAGTKAILQVKADLQNNLGSQYNGGTVSATLDQGASNAQGKTSLNTVAFPTNNTTGQTLTIGGSNGGLSINSALSTTAVLSNSTAQRIGSYVVQAGASEGLRLNSATVVITGTLGSSSPTTYLNNLKLVISNCSGSTYTSNPVNPQGSNQFSLSCNLAANSTATVDVYADIGNSTGTVVTTLSVLGQGQTSNLTFSPANNPQTGQTINVQTGSVATPSVGASAAVSALVASSLQPTVGPATAAAYNFVSSTGTSTIQEMWISVNKNAGTYYTTSDTAPVTQITVSGPGANGITSTATAPVVYTTSGGVAHVSGLSIQIPVGNAGQDVAVTPTYNFVGTNGLVTDNAVKLGMIEFKFQAGQTVKDSGLIGNSTATYATDPTLTGGVTPVFSNPMVLVASYPVVTNTNGVVGVSTGAAFGGGMQVLQFSITANAAGPVHVKQVEITPNWVGAPTHLTTATANNVQIYNTSNPSTILNSTQSATGVTFVNSTAAAIVFNTDEVVAAGTSKTYTITMDTTGLTTANSFRIDLTNALDTFQSGGAAAAVANQWAWNDSTVSGTYVDGYLVQNLPVLGPTFSR